MELRLTGDSIDYLAGKNWKLTFCKRFRQLNLIGRSINAFGTDVCDRKGHLGHGKQFWRHRSRYGIKGSVVAKYLLELGGIQDCYTLPTFVLHRQADYLLGVFEAPKNL